MERLTVVPNDGRNAGLRGFCTEQDAINRLADYEDTGLEPLEVEAAKRIAERIATADYPHNFQRERSDIAAYLWWISDLMRDAKAWWNNRIKDKEEAPDDKAEDPQ